MDTQRTIETILDLETGDLIETEELFGEPDQKAAEIFQLRTKIEEQIKTENVRYVCLYCKKPVAVRGRVNRQKLSTTFFFTHPYKSPDCIIKTSHQLSEEEVRRVKYNGEKESVLHNHLKNLIASFLRLDEGISDVLVEQTYKDVSVSKEWRRPDVMAVLADKKIAFELQLSTTFLTVIVGRTLFYRQRGIFLIWIFPNFSLENDLQKFTQKDIFYNNSLNVYVFDKEAQERSDANGKLILTCFYKDYYIEKNTLKDRWIKSFIDIADLTFDTGQYKLWFYNGDEKKKTLEAELTLWMQHQEQEQLQLIIAAKVKRCVEYLREFYTKDFDPIPLPEFCPLNSISSKDEVDALDRQLQFTSGKAEVIANLFLHGNKPRFLRFICENDNIRVNLSGVMIKGRTVLEHLLFNESDHQFEQSVSILFRSGYPLNEIDNHVLESLYNKNNFNSTDWERQCIDRWAFVTSLKSLWNKDNALHLVQIKKIIYGLMSLKHDMTIGYKFSSLRQLSMNFFEFHKNYGYIYLNAMRHYGQLEKQLFEDRNGKLKHKIDRFIADPPPQETGYKTILSEIFPEFLT